MISLYKIFIRPNSDYDNAALITAETKHIFKWEQIQMNALRFILNLSRSTSNNIVRKCVNVFTVKERIIELAISWYENSMINNPTVAYPDTPLAYINY